MNYSIFETLFLALGSDWIDYHRLLKECRHRRPKRRQIHELRTLLRRFIVALRLVERLRGEGNPTGPLRRRLKKQLASLRSLRDLQVQERHLKADPGALPLRDFRGSLKARRKREQRRVLRSLKKVSPRRLGTELLRVEEDLGALSHPRKSAQRSVEQKSKQILMKEYRVFQGCAHDPALRSDPAALHATRIQLRKFRYTWEILAPTPSLAFAANEALKELQILLGEIQDSTVMIKSLQCNHDDPEVRKYLYLEEQKQKRRIDEFQNKKESFLAAIQPPFFSNLHQALAKARRFPISGLRPRGRSGDS